MSLPPPSARRVMIDTAGYFGLADPRDQSHVAAVSIAGRLARERWLPITTNFILAETHALLLARRGRDLALRILSEIDQSATVVVRASASDEQRAREIIRRYQDKDFSLTDAISFAVMERLGLGYAFSFDQHYAQYGFALLQPD